MKSQLLTMNTPRGRASAELIEYSWTGVIAALDKMYAALYPEAYIDGTYMQRFCMDLAQTETGFVWGDLALGQEMRAELESS